MIHAWLRDRIAKLYAVNKNDGDITPEVLSIEAEIFSKGLAEIDIGPDVAPAFAQAVEGLKAQLALSTGYSSAAGRIARMEVAHAIEGLRILLSWLENRADKDGPHYAFGASVVPVTTSKVQTDMSKMTGHNADPVTSTPIPDRSEPLPVPTADPLQEPPHVKVAPPVLVGETEPVENDPAEDEPETPVTPQSNTPTPTPEDETELDL